MLLINFIKYLFDIKSLKKIKSKGSGFLIMDYPHTVLSVHKVH